MLTLTCAKWHMHKAIHHSIVCSSKRLEATKMVKNPRQKYKLYDIHKIEYYIAIKRKEEALYVLIWKALQDILLNEKKSTEQCVCSATFCVKKKNTRICIFLYIHKEFLERYIRN